MKNLKKVCVNQESEKELILRAQKGNITPDTIALDEVLQPNVEKYKKEVKKAMNK